MGYTSFQSFKISNDVLFKCSYIYLNCKENHIFIFKQCLKLEEDLILIIT